MRKLLFALMLLPVAARAQDVQLHYDLGRFIYPTEESGRQRATVTLEQFKADAWGSWYYFVDVDLSSRFVESAYTELSREFSLGSQSHFAAHVEYDGGLSREFSFQQALLVGAAYNGHSADYARTWSVQVLYKQYFKSYAGTHSYPSVQLTGVWSLLSRNKRFTFAGFADFWRGERLHDGRGCLVVLTEPQLWYNVNAHLSVGTEWELSKNFVSDGGGRTFFVNPTLAVKWNL